MFGLQFVNYGTRILHSSDLADMRDAILCEVDSKADWDCDNPCDGNPQEDDPVVPLPPYF